MGSFEPLIAPIADDHLRAKGAVRHEPCARLVARMFTFWAKKIAYCITWNWTLVLAPEHSIRGASLVRHFLCPFASKSAPPSRWS
ncbi:hypothetical protein CN093_04420 [Sinorhizobium meliloti]|nr:hypothetical protein CN093_04420 [Sinorhizobium meliloti]